jgi:phosphatidylglycerophosphate synthase
MDTTRRPVAARGNETIRSLATGLAASQVSPNQISVASVAFAALAALTLGWHNGVGDLFAILFIQLRLLCNVMDGLVAIEGNRKSALGPLFNEFPDRISDTLVLAAAGYACALPGWGWLSAVLAVSTAYIRLFGGAMGFAQDFRGPMAKQTRMHVMSAGCAFGFFESLLTHTHLGLRAAVMVVAIGSALTCATRCRAIARQMPQP